MVQRVQYENPENRSFFMKLRCFIAGWIYPAFRQFEMKWYNNYFDHTYMMTVHKTYEREIKNLSKAITKKSKENKALKKQILALTSPASSAPEDSEKNP